MKIKLNKNRGWRGLSEAVLLTESDVERETMIFSFSQEVWDDLILNHILVMTDEHNYIVCKITDPSYRLPRPEQQRSVLINNAILHVDAMATYSKDDFSSEYVDETEYLAIKHFINNKNNHTQSDWNCIGIRVIPRI